MSLSCKYFLFLYATGFILSSCKKYDEDGKRSWETANKRLTDHVWTLKEYQIDGADSGYVSYPKFGYTFIHNGSTLKFKGPYFYSKRHAGEFTAQTDLGFGGEWKFDSRKNELNMFLSIIACKGCSTPDAVFFPRGTGTWAIKKLTDKEFIIESTGTGKLFRVKYQSNQ